MNSNIGRVKRFILFYSYDNQELILFKRYFKDAAKFCQGYCHKKYHSQISLRQIPPLSLHNHDTVDGCDAVKVKL